MGIGCAMRASEGKVCSSAVCCVRCVEYNTYIHSHVCMYVFSLVMLVPWCVSVHHQTEGNGRLSELSGFDVHTDAAVNSNSATV